MSRVCAVHNEYCPDGECRWCVVPAPEAGSAIARNISANNALLHRLMARTRLVPVPGGNVEYVELSYADLDSPLGRGDKAF